MKLYKENRFVQIFQRRNCYVVRANMKITIDHILYLNNTLFFYFA